MARMLRRAGAAVCYRGCTMTPTEARHEAAPLRDKLLARFPVLARLAPEQLENLLAEARHRRVEAGAVLFEPGGACEGFPLLLDGSVRVSKSSAAGREIVLYRVSPGEACLLSGACLLGQSHYGARGVAESPVELLVIPPAAFDSLLLHSAPFRRFVFDTYGERLAEVMELVDEVAFRKLDVRLARLLLQRGPVIQATHQNLADELGTVRVFVSRLLRGFEERGWVKLERERVSVVDPKALHAFAST
jgi:CRP/FNR family transcriptional regulator